MIDYINIHTHKAANKAIYIQNIDLKNNLPSSKYLSFGIHPWDIDKTDINAQLEILKIFCIDKNIVAIGEIGLDWAIKTPVDIQKQVFKKQLEIANQFNLPVIIHCVRAWSDILEIKKEGKYKNVWIFHGFNGSLQTATQIIKSGSYLSFGKALLTNEKLKKTFTQLPKDFIFFETDNADVKIEEIYQKACEIYDICTDELKSIICNNFNKVFK
jgi:TatD DNase family protein